MKKGMLLALSVLSVAGLFACSKSNRNTTKPETERNDLYSRFVELSENVSKLPSAKDVCGLDATSTTKTMAQEIKYDLTVETDEYKEISAYDAYYSSIWESFNRLKNEGIDIRDVALENIKEFDRWVAIANDRYYVSYDQIMDQVRIIRYNHDTTVDIKSSYDSNGNTAISVVYYWHMNLDSSDILYNDSIEYVENVKWVGTRSYCDADNEFYSIIESDLAKDLKTQIDYSFVTYDDGTQAQYVTPIVNVVRDGISYILGKSDERESIDVFDENGHRLYARKKYVTGSVIDIPLYALNGWDKAYTVDDGESYAGQLIVEAGENVYTHDDPLYLYLPEYCPILFYPDATGHGLEPMISFDYKNVSEREALTKLLDYFNFSYKRDILNQIFEVANNIPVLLSERKAFNTDSLELVTVKQFKEIYARINPATFTISSIRELAREIATDTIDVNDQNPSKGIYNYIESEGTGNYTFDNGVLSLEGMKISLEPSALLSKNIDYSAKLLLIGNNGVQTLLESNKERFDGEHGLSFDFEPGNVNLSEYLNDGVNYTLEIAVFSNDSRISKAVEMGLELESYSYVISTATETVKVNDTTETYEIVTSYTIYDDNGSIKIKIEVTSNKVE